MKERLTFSHRGSDGRYYWYGRRLGGDSRSAQYSCSVAWFWGKAAPCQSDS